MARNRIGRVIDRAGDNVRNVRKCLPNDEQSMVRSLPSSPTKNVHLPATSSYVQLAGVSACVYENINRKQVNSATVDSIMFPALSYELNNKTLLLIHTALYLHSSIYHMPLITCHNPEVIFGNEKLPRNGNFETIDSSLAMNEFKRKLLFKRLVQNFCSNKIN